MWSLMNTSLTTLEQRIIALEAQLATQNVQLSSSTQGTRLIAPVEVFTVEGQLILTIDKQFAKHTSLCTTQMGILLQHLVLMVVKRGTCQGLRIINSSYVLSF